MGRGLAQKGASQSQTGMWKTGGKYGAGQPSDDYVGAEGLLF